MSSRIINRVRERNARAARVRFDIWCIENHWSAMRQAREEIKRQMEVEKAPAKDPIDTPFCLIGMLLGLVVAVTIFMVTP